jgi:hypothetical protein
MPGCGHCIHAKDELKNEIENNTIIIKDSSNAPSGVMGFPYFTNGKKSITGYPGSKEKLFMELGYVGGRVKKQKKVIPKKKLNKWQNFLKNNSGKGWTITKMKNEYKKKYK